MVIYANPDRITKVAVVGEDSYNFIEFDVSKLILKNGFSETNKDLAPNFSFSDTWNIAYEQSGILSIVSPDLITIKDNKLQWEITDTLTSFEGIIKCQIIYNTSFDGKKILRKSSFYYLAVGESLIGSDNTRPPNLDDWIEELIKAGQELVSTLQGLGEIDEDIKKVQDASDAADKLIEAAPEIDRLEQNTGLAEEWAKQAETSATSAMNAQQSANEAINEAKKWAIAPKDELEEGSSKYWAEQSEASATDAKTSADALAEAENEAKKWAIGSIEDLEEGSSKHWAEQSKEHSDTSKEWAIGGTEETNENNAKYWAEKAAEEKAKAQAWAIGGTEETNENSAKYWAEQARDVATGDIADTLKTMIGNHDKAEEAHSNQFKPILEDITEIKESLEKAGTADTIVASTPTEEKISLKFWKGTKEEYINIITKDPNTLYIVSSNPTLF